MYSYSTDALTNPYPKLSTGGYVIIDDYKLLPRATRLWTIFELASELPRICKKAAGMVFLDAAELRT